MGLASDAHPAASWFSPGFQRSSLEAVAKPSSGGLAWGQNTEPEPPQGGRQRGPGLCSALHATRCEKVK